MFAFKETSEQKKSSGSLWTGKNSLVSIYALHRALSKLKEELNKNSSKGRMAITGGSIVVQLSLGKVRGCERVRGSGMRRQGVRVREEVRELGKKTGCEVVRG